MASLEDRWVRGDMVTTYRVVTGHDKVDSGYFFNLVVDGPGSITRGVTGVFNIRGVPDRLEIRKNSFSLYVVTRQPEGVGAVIGFQLPDVADHVGQVRSDDSHELPSCEFQAHCISCGILHRLS